MLDMFARWFQKLKRPCSRVAQAVLAFALIGLVVLCLELFVWPWLGANPALKRLGLSTAFSDRVTVVERRETVTVSQDENIERQLTQSGSVLVRLVTAPVAPAPVAGRVPGFETFTGTLVTNDGIVATYRSSEPDQTVRHQAFLASGRVDEVEYVGYDRLTQLAFFRVQRDNTPAVAFTNVADLNPGRRLSLFGMNGEGRTMVTPTVLESLDRDFNLSPQTVASSEKWEGVLGLPIDLDEMYIGGPALVGNGEMAGLIGERSLDGRTTTFLIRADTVRESLDRVLAGRSARPVAGIYYRTLTPVTSTEAGVSRDRGALVFSPSGRTGLSVVAGSPAARAGLQYGDIIIAVNGAEINLDLPLSVALGRLNPGDRAMLTVLRNDTEREIELAL